ncbi:hypothetical protein D9619_010171 [Psilocybe cf. subviscida]|uniref:Uncharacterized protein n=1 Tax=Psilocybe cf. subviscida TaxID=2480587 RepID=A0A8H5ASV1_9AGAR|nr:hypothetical protein D9619_010171 [Psilocybe cf. subviscida]
MDRLPPLSATLSSSATHAPSGPPVPVVKVTAVPRPAPTPVASSNSPPSLHSNPSVQSTPSLQSSPSLHSTSSQKSMGSINTNAPLPPLPSPVRSPLLDRARSKSHEPVSALIPPPTPPKDSSATSQERALSHVNSDAQSRDLAATGVSSHMRGATEGGASQPAPLFSASTPSDSTSTSVSSASVNARAARSDGSYESEPLLSPYTSSAETQIPIQGVHSSPSGPAEPEYASPSSAERPAPPFLVLSYKAPPSVMPPAVPPPLPIATLPQALPVAGPAPAAEPPLTPTQRTTIIPPGGAPQLRNPPSPSNPLPPPIQQPSQMPPSFSTTIPTSPSPSPRASSFSPPTLPLGPPTPPTAPSLPPAHNPRGSMILYHVSLPAPSGSRPALSHAPTYQTFGNLGVHANRHSAGPIGVGEDGMLLPSMPSSGSGTASSSAPNLLSSMNAGDAATPPTPPPANRYSSHSYARSSTYSASADSVAAPSYVSSPPLDDRDSKYAVGLMIGTVKPARSQTLPRIGTPLAASFALRDLDPKTGADAHSGIDLNGSVRGSIFGGGGGGPIVAYAYDPDEDDSEDDMDDGRGDWLHNPDVWPYADGDADFHAQRGDWKVRPGRWWGGAKGETTGGAPRKEVGGGRKDDGVQLEMLGSTSTASRTSMLKAPLQSHTTPNASSRPRSNSHPYLPPYRPPTTLDTLLGRGAASALTLVILVVGLMALFIAYPITQVYGAEAGVAAKILGNTAINSTGQAVA